VKELTDIQTKGCPDGIEAIDVSGMDTWVFGVSVLGDETVYRVSLVAFPFI
jgi:ubiquitin-conjugating enzyme E2 W